MAANNTANVSTIKGVVGGYFYTAAEGTTLPTDNSTALASGFVNIGYISDAGITRSKSATSTDFHDLNGDVIENAVSEITRTIKQKFVEVNEAALKEAKGQSNVSVNGTSGLITVHETNDDMDYRVIVLELVLKDSRKWRRVIPRAKITEWGDETMLSTDLAGFELTYTEFANSSGYYEIDYIDGVSS